MEPTLTVSINRDGANAISSDVDSVEARDSLALVLRSHGGPAHVHCKLYGEITAVAHLDDSNYYVEEADETHVSIPLDDVDDPVTGTLEVSTGYGANATTVDVTVRPGSRSIDVDDRLAEPDRTEPEPTALESFVDRLSAGSGLEPGTLAVVALGAVAIAIAAGTAGIVGGAAAFVGILAVTIGVVVALVLLVRR